MNREEREGREEGKQMSAKNAKLRERIFVVMGSVGAKL